MSASYLRKRSGPKRRGSWWHCNPPGAIEFISKVEVLCWRLTDAEFLEEYLSMGSFSKMFGKATVAGGETAAVDSDFEQRWPNLYLLMTHQRDDSGKPRQTSTFTFVCEQGLWKGGVKDRDHAMSLWRSGESFTALLEALETALESGTADWKVQETRSRK